MLVACERSGTQKGEEHEQGEEIPGHGKSILRKQMDIIHRVSHSMLSKGHVPRDREPGASGTALAMGCLRWYRGGLALA